MGGRREDFVCFSQDLNLAESQLIRKTQDKSRKVKVREGEGLGGHCGGRSQCWNRLEDLLSDTQ